MKFSPRSLDKLDAASSFETNSKLLILLLIFKFFQTELFQLFAFTFDKTTTGIFSLNSLMIFSEFSAVNKKELRNNNTIDKLTMTRK